MKRKQVGNYKYLIFTLKIFQICQYLVEYLEYPVAVTCQISSWILGAAFSSPDISGIQILQKSIFGLTLVFPVVYLYLPFNFFI